MSTQPMVCAVMLKHGRDELAARAVASFKAQTYIAKRLLVWDTGELTCDLDSTGDGEGEIVHVPAEAYREMKIGALRNEANAFWTEYPIIMHWDSDDWSHPNRIAEQVALLQASGKQVVGYREMLFWREPRNIVPTTLEGGDGVTIKERKPGEAWLYSHARRTYCIGTSLCYWRETWERKRFRDDYPTRPGATGEDTEFLRNLDSLGVSAMGHCAWLGKTSIGEVGYVSGDPRLIASIHGQNSMPYDGLENSPSWRRVPEWDKHCAEAMKL